MAEAAQQAPGAAPMSQERETALPKIGKKSKFSDTAPAPGGSANTTTLPPLKSLPLAKTVPANVGNERGVYELRTTCNWKGNEDISTWFKKKEKMDRERRSRPARTAMKDANWILARREKQMKSIQRRQKQEKLLLKEEGRNPNMKKKTSMVVQQVDKDGNPVAPVQARKPPPQSSTHGKFQEVGKNLVSMTGAMSGMGHHMMHENKFARLRDHLEWQKPPILPDQLRVSKDRETSVWVMPGVFHTKTVTHL